MKSQTFVLLFSLTSCFAKNYIHNSSDFIQYFGSFTAFSTFGSVYGDTKNLGKKIINVYKKLTIKTSKSVKKEKTRTLTTPKLHAKTDKNYKKQSRMIQER